MGNKDSQPKDGSLSIIKSDSKQQILTKTNLEKTWTGLVDPQFIEVLSSSLFVKSEGLKTQDVNAFAENLINGNYPTKAEVILQLIGRKDGLERFLAGVISSVIIKEKRIDKPSFKSWNQPGVDGAKFVRLQEFCLRQAGGPKEEYSEQDICTMLSSVDNLVTFASKSLFKTDESAYSFFPTWSREEDLSRPLDRCSVLTMEDILFLNLHLPVSEQLSWRLLFSAKMHGESFSRFSQMIMNQGPLLIVIEDKDKNVFGGFVSVNMALGPNYVGTPSSFLFSLHPKMEIYHASHFNENFAYMNSGQQTMPNGFGMGGCLQYFGIFLDAEFGKGICNDSCTTFRGFTRFTPDKEFRLAEVEVWGVGKPPPTGEELGERSVLDGNAEAQAILAMAGKKVYSEGLREKPKN